MQIGKTQLGATVQQISNIGLGTMYFGSKVSEAVSFSILDKYYESGGTFLDSANKYASWIEGCEGGESEYIIGKWLKNRKNRNELFLSSKVGFAYGEIPRSLKKEIIISECEKSLKRMGVDTIDLYFEHTYDAETPVEESMEAFYQLKKAGKIRFAGASNMYSWQLLESNEAAKSQNWEGFCCLQQRHSYLQPSLDADFGTQLLLTPEIKQLCTTKNITIMAYSPLLGGAYTDNSKAISPYYESKSSETKKAVLQQTALEQNVSPNAVVLAWMLQSEPSVIPIVAASNLKQLSENLEVITFRLSNQQMILLNQTAAKPIRYS